MDNEARFVSLSSLVVGDSERGGVVAEWMWIVDSNEAPSQFLNTNMSGNQMLMGIALRMTSPSVTQPALLPRVNSWLAVLSKRTVWLLDLRQGRHFELTGLQASFMFWTRCEREVLPEAETSARVDPPLVDWPNLSYDGCNVRVQTRKAKGADRNLVPRTHKLHQPRTQGDPNDCIQCQERRGRRQRETCHPVQPETVIERHSFSGIELHLQIIRNSM